MFNYIMKLRKETDELIEKIESSESNILKKSLEASHVLAETFNQLKTFISSYKFKNEEEEISFLKLKEHFYYRLRLKEMMSQLNDLKNISKITGNG